jgi:hypothetical protein
VQASQLMVFLWPALSSLLIGFVLVALTPTPPQWFTSLARLLSFLVPAIAAIPEYSADQSTASLLMTSEWVFVFWYLQVWFGKFAPWRSEIRAATRKKAAELRPGQRAFALFGYLVLLAYLLGDLQLINFPTFLNSRFAYPPDTASLLVRPIYGSNTALMLYAWISPFGEATILWIIANATVNLPSYLGLSKK